MNDGEDFSLKFNLQLNSRKTPKIKLILSRKKLKNALKKVDDVHLSIKWNQF